MIRKTLGKAWAIGMMLVAMTVATLAMPASAAGDDCDATSDAETLVCLPGVPMLPLLALVDDCSVTEANDCGGVRIFYACTQVDYEGQCWESRGSKCLDDFGADYGAPTLPSGADDNFDSGISMGNCWQKYYSNANYGGTSWWCKSSCPNFGGNTNSASSFKLY